MWIVNYNFLYKLSISLQASNTERQIKYTRYSIPNSMKAYQIPKHSRSNLLIHEIFTLAVHYEYLNSYLRSNPSNSISFLKKELNYHRDHNTYHIEIIINKTTIITIIFRFDCFFLVQINFFFLAIISTLEIKKRTNILYIYI